MKATMWCSSICVGSMSALLSLTEDNPRVCMSSEGRGLILDLA